MDFACSSCHNHSTNLVLDLGRSAIANAYTPQNSLVGETIFPLSLWHCPNCNWLNAHPQLSHEVIFPESYAYASGISQTWIDHCQGFAQSTFRKMGLSKIDLVMEVASNDGTLLKEFAKLDVQVLGIEPTATVAQLAVDAHIPTECNFLGKETALDIVRRHGTAKLVVANNVLAHVPDLHDFISGLGILMGADGLLSIEFPDALNMLDNGQFDTIYHEHFSYITLPSLLPLLMQHGLYVSRVESIAVHGGSLRIWANKSQQLEQSKEVAALLVRDEERLNNALLVEFRNKALLRRTALTTTLLQFAQAELLIAGVGAAAKGATLLNYAGVGNEIISFIMENNPLKQGQCLPGTGIPIISFGEGLDRKPDVVLVLAWNLYEEFRVSLIKQNWHGLLLTSYPRIKMETL